MEGVDQLVDGISGMLFCGVGQMSVAHCGGGAAVAEERLDMTKA